MHQSRPYGLFSRGAKLTADDIAFIDHYCKKVSNFKQISNLESLKYTRELPGGGFVIIQNAAGVFKATAFKPESIQEQNDLTGLAPTKVPMLFSGVVQKSILSGGEGLPIRLTNTCSRRVGNYKNPVSTNAVLQRFRCEYDEYLKYFFVPEYARGYHPDRILFSQYHKLKAGWYSGAMAEAIQIVGGYGRQDIESLPNETIERAEMVLPAKALAKIEEELKDVRLPGYLGAPHKEGQIKYKFMSYETDLISFDSHNEPWLVRVDKTGVWAMPLPIIPATKTQSFRDYIVSVNDTEIEKILDRFGGMPSGETFPDDFQRWVRAGVIVKVCDSSDFHSYSAYSTACGWSCNSDGTSLINTCYDYVNNYCYGYTYQIRLNLKPAEDRGWSYRKDTRELSANESRIVAEYLSDLFSGLPEDTHPLTISMKYKIRRIQLADILARANNHRGSNDVDYWDAYNCEPIAQHTGYTSCTNSGYLYGGIGFKVPEPFFDGCVHVDFSAQEEKDSYPKVDTIIYAYYIGNDLKVIKNFHDERKAIREVESNFEDVMVVGSWEQTEYVGLTGFAGEYYSSDFDHRQEIAPVEVHTNILGVDKGYGKPLARFHYYFWTDGLLSRYRYYTHKMNRETIYTRGLSDAFIVPFFQRNAAIYAEMESNGGSKIEESVKMHSAADPHSYQFWTYSDWHWIDGGLKKTGKPIPVNGNPVWAEVHEYSSNSDPLSDFADDGDWVGPVPADVTSYVNPPGGLTMDWYGGDPPAVEEYQEERATEREMTYGLHLSLLDRPVRIHDREHEQRYYSVSPDAYGNILYEDACRVVFGDVTYANISIKNQSGRRYSFGHSELVDHSAAHTFIGVINE
ncbi:hypothetical protein [Acinetobacter lwoffii]|uniref:hypothetical protein n=1 Tax=Acinetobacter lwoffii TaxID=28090 RepID=UPI003F8F65A1